MAIGSAHRVPTLCLMVRYCGLRLLQSNPPPVVGLTELAPSRLAPRTAVAPVGLRLKARAVAATPMSADHRDSQDLRMRDLPPLSLLARVRLRPPPCRPAEQYSL